MKKTFTLIELLVVIAVIGLLMTLLLPSLSKVKESGKLAVCMSNQKQIATAIFNTASENDGRFLAALSPGQVHWVKVIEAQIKGVDTVSNADFRNANSDRNSIWYCPSYENVDGMYGVASWVHYGYNNTDMVGGGGSAKKDDDGNKTFGAYGAYIAHVEEAEDVLLIGDSVHWAGDRGHWEMTFINYQFRHHFDQSMNFTFVDGHIENLKVSTLTTDKTQLQKLRDGSWR